MGVGAKVAGIGTVTIHVADLGRARHFYAELLGLPVVYDGDAQVALDVGAGTRILLHRSDVDVSRSRHGRLELHLRVRDVDAAVRFLRERGTPVLREPGSEDGGGREAVVLDPDGYPLFLAQDVDGDASGKNGRQAEADTVETAMASRVVIDGRDGRVTVGGVQGLRGARVVDGEAEVFDLGGGILVRGGEDDLVVEVDQDAHVEVRTDNHVRVHSLRAGVTVHTSDGHVTVEDVVGPSDLFTGGGHVTARNVDGPVRVRTDDGHVRVSGDPRDVSVQTGDGDVTIAGAQGHLVAVTGSGRIEVVGSLSTAELSTGDGDVTVEWCAGFAHVTTGCGDISISGTLLGESKLRTGDGWVKVGLPEDTGVAVRARGGRIANAFADTDGRDGTLSIRATRITVDAIATAVR